MYYLSAVSGCIKVNDKPFFGNSLQKTVVTEKNVPWVHLTTINNTNVQKSVNKCIFFTTERATLATNRQNNWLEKK